MSRMPRLLPLIGVAAAGVIAANAVAGARSLPELFGPSAARAETAQPAPARPAARPAAARPAAARPAAVCAPTAAQLAAQAGLSPSELRVLQSLGARRGQLDAREQGLSTQLALMAAAEQKVDGKIRQMNALKAEITALLAQADQAQTSEVDRLVRVYERMKPKDAAPIFVTLSDTVRLPVAARMKEQALALVLAEMPPAEARVLTERLAARFAAEALAARARAAAAAGTPPARPAAAPTPRRS